MAFKLFDSVLLNFVIFIHLCEIEYAQKTISISDIEISFDNKGDFTDFILKSSLKGRLEGVWMGVGFGPYAEMVKFILLI